MAEAVNVVANAVCPGVAINISGIPTCNSFDSVVSNKASVVCVIPLNNIVLSKYFITRGELPESSRISNLGVVP